MNSKKTDLKTDLKLALPIGTECVVVGALASAHVFIASHGNCEMGFEDTGSLYRILLLLVLVLRSTTSVNFFGVRSSDVFQLLNFL